MSEWQEEMTRRIGQKVLQARGERSALWLSQRTAELGMKISRSGISELEKGKRRSISIAEVFVIAAALEIPPLLLVYPEFPNGRVDVLPGISATSRTAQLWASGEVDTVIIKDRMSRKPGKSAMIELVEELEKNQVLRLRAISGESGLTDDDRRLIEENAERIHYELAQLGAVLGTGRDDGEG